jgi:hypothetical protein
MICRMPLLNGPRVRHLAAERGWDLPTLARKAALHPRTLANTTRPDSPQPVSLPALYALAGALAYSDQDARDVAASIVIDPVVAAEIRAAKESETKETKREPTGPTRRQENEKTKGPKRAAVDHAAAVA